jgi:hypothetical protein
MRVFIDFSVNTVSGEALGAVSGEIDCGVEPLIGDAISLMVAPDGQVMPLRPTYGWSLKVVGRTIQPNQEKNALLLSLEDMTIETPEQAVAILAYMEKAFRLNVDIYHEI